MTATSMDQTPLARRRHGRLQRHRPELARVLAANGFDLILAAEDPRIEEAAVRLREHGGAVRPVQVELRTAAGVDELYRTCAATGPVDVAALNAGVGRGGPFIENDLTDEVAIIDLNITSTVRLAKKLLPEMVRRGEGRVLVTSSIASMMPGTYQAVYNASKSFLQSFTEAVAEELREEPVTITSLMPGPTETEFFHRAEMDDTQVGSSSKDDPAQVAEQGFRALMAGKDKIVAGSAGTKAQGVMSDVLPDRLKAVMHRRMAAPGSGR
jgi:uncharacterized protein